MSSPLDGALDDLFNLTRFCKLYFDFIDAERFILSMTSANYPGRYDVRRKRCGDMSPDAYKKCSYFRGIKTLFKFDTLEFH